MIKGGDFFRTPSERMFIIHLDSIPFLPCDHGGDPSQLSILSPLLNDTLIMAMMAH